MTAGFGTTPLGSTPFGFGTPAMATAPPTQQPTAARYIDLWERDYVLGSDGEYERMPETRQRVVIALNTIKGSSAVLLGFGLKLPAKIDQTFTQRATNAIKDALRHLTTGDSPALRVNAATVELMRTGGARLTVDYTDLTTGEPDFVTF